MIIIVNKQNFKKRITISLKKTREVCNWIRKVTKLNIESIRGSVINI